MSSSFSPYVCVPTLTIFRFEFSSFRVRSFYLYFHFLFLYALLSISFSALRFGCWTKKSFSRTARVAPTTEVRYQHKHKSIRIFVRYRLRSVRLCRLIFYLCNFLPHCLLKDYVYLRSLRKYYVCLGYTTVEKGEKWKSVRRKLRTAANWISRRCMNRKFPIEFNGRKLEQHKTSFSSVHVSLFWLSKKFWWILKQRITMTSIGLLFVGWREPIVKGLLHTNTLSRIRWKIGLVALSYTQCRTYTDLDGWNSHIDSLMFDLVHVKLLHSWKRQKKLWAPRICFRKSRLHTLCEWKDTTTTHTQNTLDVSEKRASLGCACDIL